MACHDPFRSAPSQTTGGTAPCLVAAIVVLFVPACQRQPDQRSAKMPKANSQFQEPARRGLDESDSGHLTAAGSDVATELSVPLPPGWAEQAAFERSSAGPSAEVQPDTAERRAVDEPGQRQGPARAAGTDDDRSAESWTGPEHPDTKPRPLGDYTVMLLVFVAPLVLLIPLVWAWHLIRTFRADLAERHISSPAA